MDYAYSEEPANMNIIVHFVTRIEERREVNIWKLIIEFKCIRVITKKKDRYILETKKQR